MGELAKALSLDGGVISLVGAGGKTTFMFHLARERVRAGQSVLATTTTKIFNPTCDPAPVRLLAKNAPDLIRQWNAVGPPPLFTVAAARLDPGRNKLIGFSPEVIDRIADAGLFRWIVVEADGAARRPLKAPASHEPVIPRRSDVVVAFGGLDAVGKPLHDDHVFRAEIYARLTGLNMGEPVTAASIAALMSHPDGLFRGVPETAEKIVFLNKAEGDDRRAAGRETANRLAGFAGRVVLGRLAPPAPLCGKEGEGGGHPFTQN